MESSPSPWSRADGPPSVTLPPPPASPPPPESPSGRQAPPLPNARPGGRLRVLWIALTGLIVVVLSAAVGSTVTLLSTHTDNARSVGQSSAAPGPSLAPPSSQASAEEASSAKQNLCHIVDLSVGQKSEGGFREQGNLNVTVALKAINSVLAVQNALVPAVPPSLAAVARKYVSTTLDVTTAAMGAVPASEVNRLTDISNQAMYALVDACGLPR